MSNGKSNQDESAIYLSWSGCDVTLTSGGVVVTHKDVVAIELKGAFVVLRKASSLTVIPQSLISKMQIDKKEVE